MCSGILTFDVGTSSCKAVVFSMEGALLAEGRGSYPLLKPRKGWAEQRVEDILAGIRGAVREIACQYDVSKVCAIGISSQMAAHCLVDADGRPLTNIISWMDRRASEEVEAYNQCFTQQDTLDLTGMDMLITPAHTITKLRWMQKHMPELLRRARYVVQVKELLIHELTGQWVSDKTTLKGIVRQSDGSVIPEIMQFTRCPESLIPPVKAPHQQAGRLREGGCGFEAFRAGIPVAVGWNDMNAAFLGMAGVPEESVGLDLTGTSEHFGMIARHIPERFRCDGVNHVPFLEGREVCYGVTSSGGQAFDWFVKNIYASGDVQQAYAEIMPQLAAMDARATRGLYFLPYIEGERNPWNMPNARGVFFGLNGSHNRLHLAMAVMEGVCFALHTILDRMPQRPGRVIVAGGSARNDVWNQMKADVLELPYEKLHTTEAGCNGAAILALACLEPEADIASIARRFTRTRECFAPNAEWSAYYQDKYRRYLALLERAKEDFERMV